MWGKWLWASEKVDVCLGWLLVRIADIIIFFKGTKTNVKSLKIGKWGVRVVYLSIYLSLQWFRRSAGGSCAVVLHQMPQRGYSRCLEENKATIAFSATTYSTQVSIISTDFSFRLLKQAVGKFEQYSFSIFVWTIFLSIFVQKTKISAVMDEKNDFDFHGNHQDPRQPFGCFK